MIWKDRIKQYPHRYTLTNVSGSTYDFTEVTGEVIEAGTPVNAENMNKLIQRDGDDIKDTVTTFIEASTRANIATGEKTSTIFGKIKKFFTDLKPHAFTAPSSALSDSTDTVPSDKLLKDTNAAMKLYVDGTISSIISVKQPDRTYVLINATDGTFSLYLANATYTHTYPSAGAYLIEIRGTGASAICAWGDGTSETVNLTDGFKVDRKTDKDKYIEIYLGTNCATIGSDAFQGCSKLTSITIPNSVTSVGSYAFDGCSGLTSITIPDSVTSIGEGAFYNCIGLTSVTIPSSVTSIGSYAFYRCRLTSVTIPDSVTSISSNAFSDCSGLTSITIPSSVTSIGSGAFYDCIGLTSITIPNSVTSIGYSAFSGCRSLTSITIPSSVTSIDSWAFQYCKRLTSVEFLGTMPTISTGVFTGCRISDIIAQTSAIADSAATAITAAGGTLLTNYRKLY